MAKKISIPSVEYRKLRVVAEMLGCKVTDIIVTSGAALYLIGLRKTYSDMDIEIPQRLWDKLCSNATYPRSTFEGKAVISLPGDIDVHLSDGSVSTEITNDIRHLTPDELLKFKRWLVDVPSRNPEKRNQDLLDINALSKLVKEYVE